MRIRAAVLHQMGAPAPYAQSRPLKIEELELDPPGEGDNSGADQGRGAVPFRLICD